MSLYFNRHIYNLQLLSCTSGIFWVFTFPRLVLPTQNAWQHLNITIRSYSTSGPVSTWMGDRLWRVNHLGM